jgi:hypothetical protein
MEGGLNLAILTVSYLRIGTRRSLLRKNRQQSIVGSLWIAYEYGVFHSQPRYLPLDVCSAGYTFRMLTRTCSVRDKSRIAHELLRSDELPRPGTVVSIDAEFVQMQQVR